MTGQVKLVEVNRHGNNSSPTGHLEYRVNSYCEVPNAAFDLDPNVIVKGRYKASCKQNKQAFSKH